MDETSLVGVWTLVSYVITDEKDSLCQAFFGAIWNERKTR